MVASRRVALEFSQVRLLTSDFRKSWHFYRDRMGLTPAKGHGEPPYGEFVFHGRPLLALFDRKRMASAVGLSPRPPSSKKIEGPALVFEVPDVDRAARGLRNRGVRLLKGPTDRPEWGLRTIHLLDPDQYLVEVYSRRRRR